MIESYLEENIYPIVHIWLYSFPFHFHLIVMWFFIVLYMSLNFKLFEVGTAYNISLFSDTKEQSWETINKTL